MSFKNSIQNRKTIGLFVGVCGLLLNLYSLYLHATIDFIAPTTEAATATFTWVFSIFLFCFAIYILYPEVKVQEEKDNKLTVREKILLTTILTVALILRIYKIDYQGLYLDEWYWLTNAQGILDGLIRSPFGFIGDQPSNMPAYVVSLFLIVTNNAFLAVRLPGVLYSMMTIIFVFIFLRYAINKKAAFIASILLSTAIWDIHMTHFGWNNVNLNPFLISGFILFFYLAIRFYSPRHIIIAGIFLGVGISLLYTAALTTIVAFCSLVYYFIVSKQRKKVVLLAFLLFVLSFIVISPTLAKIYKYPDQSLARHKKFTLENVDYSKEKNGYFYYIEQFKLALGDFSYKKDKFLATNQLWGATLDPISSVFLPVGLLYVMLNVSKFSSFLLIISYLVMFIPVVVLYRFTSIWREYAFLPTVFMLSSMGIFFLAHFTSKIWRIIKIPIRLNTSRNAILFSIGIVYTLIWVNLYINYSSSYAKNVVDTYEWYCKKIADYIANTVPEQSMLLLPDEMCKDLISITLLKRFNYQVYNNQNNVPTPFTKKPFVVQVLHSNSLVERQDTKVLGEHIETSYQKKVVKDEHGIYGIVYVPR